MSVAQRSLSCCREVLPRLIMTTLPHESPTTPASIVAATAAVRATTGANLVRVRVPVKVRLWVRGRLWVRVRVRVSLG